MATTNESDLKSKPKIQVGETAYIFTPGQIKSGQRDHDRLVPVIVTKVGRKWIEVVTEDNEMGDVDFRLNLEDGAVWKNWPSRRIFNSEWFRTLQEVAATQDALAENTIRSGMWSCIRDFIVNHHLAVKSISTESIASIGLLLGVDISKYENGVKTFRKLKVYGNGSESATIARNPDGTATIAGSPGSSGSGATAATQAAEAASQDPKSSCEEG